MARKLPGEIVAERFLLERLAGRGGMGEVFRARDLETDPPVALKIIEFGDHDSGWFHREAKTLSKLRHPNIARYVAHGLISNDCAFLVMEWLDGEDLEMRLVRGPLGIEESVQLARQIAKALDFVNEEGVVHRDIKPANIFLVGGALNEVKLLDFGVSRVRGETGVLTLRVKVK